MNRKYVKMRIEEISRPHLYSSSGLIQDSSDDYVNTTRNKAASSVVKQTRSSIPPSSWLLNLDESNIKTTYLNPQTVAEILHIPATENIPNFYEPTGAPNYSIEDVSEVNQHSVYSDDVKNIKYIVLNSLHHGAKKLYIPPVASFLYSTADVVVTPKKKMFVFNLNPSHVTPSYRKVISEIKTRGGYEIQHWGNTLTEIKVVGRSRGLIPHSIDPIQNADITLSQAWQKLMDLKDLYTASNSNPNVESSTVLSLTYFDTMYLGYFTDFVGPEADAEAPYLVNYSFSFKVIDELSI